MNPVSAPPSAAAASRAEVAPVPGLGLLTFDGPDAAGFLHGQLSSDVAAMAPGDAGWSSYNSPKGRMLGSMLLWRRAPESFVAFVAADLAESLRKRLAMFVLRAKVAVADLTAAGRRFGVSGAGARDAVAAALGAAPDAAHGVVADGALVVATPDGRMLIHAPNDAADAILRRLQSNAVATGADDWERASIAAGVPLITRATQDLFVPQTANWDLVGGVNFRKGCYPGQEIVARMQYLGRLKERLFAFHVSAAVPAAGTPLYSPAFGEQACGTVVNAAPSATGGSDLLAVVQWSAMESDSLHLGAPDGPRLAVRALPYEVPAATAPNRPKL
ncbi:MAG: folate-binding protein [Burkholderiales bacterium]